MIMFEVLEYFTDLQDGNFEYKVGDIYPREGYKPTQKRINQLASDENVRKRPIIKAIEAPEIDKVDDTGEIAEEKPKKRRKKAESVESDTAEE